MERTAVNIAIRESRIRRRTFVEWISDLVDSLF